MNYDEFIKEVKDRLRNATDGTLTIEIYSVRKNNDTEYKGIIMRDPDTNISPIVYLEGYYERYTNGALTIEEIVTDVLRAYSHNRGEQFSTEEYSDPDYILDKVFFKLVNKQRNKELFKTVPYVVVDGMDDLAMIFAVKVENPLCVGGSLASISVTKDHLKMWNRPLTEIKDLAVSNTPKIFPWEFLDLKGMMGSMGMPSDGMEHIPMYILTNQYRVNGASTILYLGMLEHIRISLGSDYYILPSSIHEVIIVPTLPEIDEQYLSSMVREINRTTVLPDEVLSDSVYLYSENEFNGSQVLQAL